MKVSEFDFPFSEDLIAQKPLADRASSRMLCLNRESGLIEHLKFRDIVQTLNPDDLLILNNTRVTARRLFGTRSTGGMVELFVMGVRGAYYEALSRPSKKIRVGDRIRLEHEASATIIEDLGEGRKLFELSNPEILTTCGEVPLPPYIHEKLDHEERYQTVYSKVPGSMAAPTAGLHFTQKVLQDIQDKGIKTAYVTLDVGLDTFRTVQTENVEDHVIHGEFCTMPQATADAINMAQGRIIAVGTTTVRTLESFAIGGRKVDSGSKNTHIFMAPGYEFQVVDGILTNFHMPKTTMLFMLSAFVGHDLLLQAYQEAIECRYRFLSFGDSMLIL